MKEPVQIGDTVRWDYAGQSATGTVEHVFDDGLYYVAFPGGIGQWVPVTQLTVVPYSSRGATQLVEAVRAMPQSDEDRENAIADLSREGRRQLAGAYFKAQDKANAVVRVAQDDYLLPVRCRVLTEDDTDAMLGWAGCTE